MASLPLHVANHIARACGLPGLFIGEHKGVRIEYIWAAKRSFWHKSMGLIGTTIIVKSNLWRVGLIDYGVEGVSALVELPQRDDFAWKVQFVQFNRWNTSPWGRQLALVDFFYVDTSGFINNRIVDQKLGTVLETRLGRAYWQDVTRIKALSEKPAKVLAPPTSRRDLIERSPGITYIDMMPKFSKSLLFGCQGWNDASATLNSPAFILDVTRKFHRRWRPWKSWHWVFAETDNGIYGIIYNKLQMSFATPKHNLMLLWGADRYDWTKLVLNSRSEHFRLGPHHTGREYMYLKLSLSDVEIESFFYVDDRFKTPRIWHRLQPMIKSLETDAWIQKRLRGR